MKIIIKNKEVEIDDEDYQKVINFPFPWTVGKNGYVVAVVKGPKGTRSLKLHRYLMTKEGQGWVDHIDRNPLNNKKENLRWVTPSQSRQNSEKQKRNLLGVKGVKETSSGRYRARIQVGGQHICLGTYKTIERAAKAYNDAATKYFGEYAGLNQF